MSEANSSIQRIVSGQRLLCELKNGEILNIEISHKSLRISSGKDLIITPISGNTVEVIAEIKKNETQSLSKMSLL